MNCDIITNVDLKEITDFHILNNSTITMALKLETIAEVKG